MNVRDVGEFGLIRRLIRKVQEKRGGPDNASPSGVRLLVDVGDDTAAWRVGSVAELFTTDTVVEGVHFTEETVSWQDLGWKIMAANVSDIAAMGGVPLYALVTLGLPPETGLPHLDDLYEGMLALGNDYGVRILGGDVVRSPVTFVTIGLTGLNDGALLMRSAARPGDRLAVAGYLGSSAGGLELLKHACKTSEEASECLRQAHQRPRPCVAQGRILSKEGVKAAIDVSDGLLDDLGKLCQASGVAARVDRDAVPIHPALKEVFPQKYLEFALGGGEDYQLLFAAAPSVIERVVPMLTPSATVIGDVVEGPSGKVTLLGPAGEEVPGPQGGWDHFG